MKNDSKYVVIASANEKRRNDVARLVESTGCSFRTFERSSELLVEVLDAEVDLLILDEDVEEMDGLESLTIVGKSRPRLPVIFVTGDPSVKTTRALARMGVKYKLIAPYGDESLEDLGTVVRRILEE